MSDLKIIPVEKLPTDHDGFVDCSAIGCTANGVRLNNRFIGRKYLNCLACRNFLIHEPGRGWRLEENSQEDILRRRDEAREKNTPRVGSVWEALKKMRKAA